ncbi:DUF2786 domain-containing protein [Nocardiopsis mangrovi]|uniref:DUF2786 domain-containing protein n=1 Tax=Nocardiopsis mangrovi TaxID=1179818 RepID=A0ABV9DNP3_9ACTN
MGRADQGRGRAGRHKGDGRGRGSAARDPAAGGGTRSGAAPAPEAAVRDDLIGAALDAHGRGDHAGVRWYLDQLTARPDERSCDDADRALVSRLVATTTSAWHRGWQPAELVRHVRRAAGERQAGVAADMMAAELRRYDPRTIDASWDAQLASVGAHQWWDGDDAYVRAWTRRAGALRAEWIEAAVEALHVLSRLPRITLLRPPPGRARRTAAPSAAAGAASVDRRMLDKVRALLGKAESTGFPAEADALTARAQELMARHRIDEALLAAAEAGDTGGPVGRRIPVDDPYPDAKAVLLDTVAEANGCRAVWDQDLGWCTVVGFPGELDAVELMFTSLLVQATGTMAGGRRKAFRHSFLHAFAQRIGERLRAAAGAEERRAAEERPGGDLLPVLAARDRQVEDATEDLFPQTVRGRVRGVHDHEGWESGRAAADDTALDPRGRLPGGR